MTKLKNFPFPFIKSMDQINDTPSNLKRLSILVSKDVHKSIKVHALNADQSMKDYIVSIILKEVEKQEPQDQY